MRLLLISNSTMPGQAYLDYPKKEIKNFLGNKRLNCLFIPYAAVTFSYEEYEKKVAERFNEIGHNLTSIHRYTDVEQAVNDADVLVVGGGNTWQLVRKMRENGLFPILHEKVNSGTPYVGWSAGANVACPTLRTTNDMPIIDPLGFDTLNLVAFQINPHYLDKSPEGHGGETREQRIQEFIEINPDTYVVGLREGSILRYDNSKLQLIGHFNARIFKKAIEPIELSESDDFSFLMR